MRSSADTLVLAMWQGRASWIGTAVDAAELASYVEDADNRVVPQSPAVVDRMLSDLREAGLVANGHRPLSYTRGIDLYRPFVLTEDGETRARELEAIDEHFPPYPPVRT